MGQRLIISEQERTSILKMYNLLMEEDIRPLQKLMECKYTTDGKYIIYDGNAYSTITGELVPINEGWSLSDILHTGADFLSMGLDFVIPGSGAVVDVLNAVSYVIEAEFKDNEEKDSLYLMALITFAFVIIPGPLQAIATPLKRAVKTGVGMASKVVVKGLKIIGGVLDKLFVKLPATIKEALKSPLAKNIMGKWSEKISGFIDNFMNRVRRIMSKLTGKEAGEKVGKEAIERIDGEVFAERFKFKEFTGKKEGLWCESIGFCNRKGIIEAWSKKLPKSSLKFNPSKVKVLTESVVEGRKILHLQLEGGEKILFYRSTGSAVESTGKQVGEWFVIPGFAKNDGWFIKTDETIAFTKGGNGYLTEMAEFLAKNGPESLGKEVGKTAAETTAKAGLNKTTKNLLSNFINKLPKIAKGQFLLKKLGFVVGKTYRYFGELGKAVTVTIKNITDKGVEVLFKDNTTKTIPVETFIKGSVGTPWFRKGYGVTVPFFIKRLSDVILSDGDIDYEKLESLPDLDPESTSKESLDYSKSEDESTTPTTTPTTEFPQNWIDGINNKGWLIRLGSHKNKIPGTENAIKFVQTKVNAKSDGIFGPETEKKVKEWQTANNLTSDGKVGKNTLTKMLK